MFADHAVMSMSVFRTTWLKLVPHILTARPMTDLDLPIQQSHDLPRSEPCRGGEEPAVEEARGGEEPAVEEARGLNSDHTNSLNK